MPSYAFHCKQGCALLFCIFVCFKVLIAFVLMLLFMLSVYAMFGLCPSHPYLQLFKDLSVLDMNCFGGIFTTVVHTTIHKSSTRKSGHFWCVQVRVTCIIHAIELLHM